MRIILVVCLIIVGISPSRAAAPTRAAKAPPAPVSVNIRTAGDLADACTTRPTDRVSFARLNFCNGFAQGVLQTEPEPERDQDLHAHPFAHTKRDDERVRHLGACRCLSQG